MNLLTLAILMFMPFAVLQDKTATPPMNFSGVVTDKVEYAPIANVHIWIHAENGDQVFSALSSQSGLFSINLPDGNYAVMLESPGFEPASKMIRINHQRSVQWQIRLCPDHDNMEDIFDNSLPTRACSTIQKIEATKQ